jgi:hypothetical protein
VRIQKVIRHQLRRTKHGLDAIARINGAVAVNVGETQGSVAASATSNDTIEQTDRREHRDSSRRA